jgi:D-glycero-alpha-D-manno-heptose 1-phosphate guanylyltransferase
MIIPVEAQISDKITSKLSAVILVGGFGTRIRHLTGDIPKPLVKVHGKPFLHWVLLSLKNKGVDNVYLLTHYASDQIESFAKLEEDPGFPICCVKERKPAGTGGALLDLLLAAEHLTSPFLLLNGDSLLVEYSLQDALNCVTDGIEAVIFGVAMSDASRYGTLKCDDNEKLIAFKEKAPGSGVINTGAYLFTRQVFSQFRNSKRPLSLEFDVIPTMLDSGVNIKVLHGCSPFIDIGTEASLAEADLFVQTYFKDK